MKNMILYEFLYCDCIYESSFETISLHYTPEGAQKALEKHKDKKLQEHIKYVKRCENWRFPPKLEEFGEFASWKIQEITVEP